MGEGAGNLPPVFLDYQRHSDRPPDPSPCLLLPSMSTVTLMVRVDMTNEKDWIPLLLPFDSDEPHKNSQEWAGLRANARKAIHKDERRSRYRAASALWTLSSCMSLWSGSAPIPRSAFIFMNSFSRVGPEPFKTPLDSL